MKAKEPTEQNYRTFLGKAAKLAAKPVTLKSLPLTELNVVAVVFQSDEDDDGRPVFDVEVLDEAAYKRSPGIPSKPVKCDCCNHGLKYACLVEHTPTGKFYNVGRDCAASIECLKGALHTVENASLTVAQRAQCDARERDFRKNNPDAVTAYEWALNGATRLAKDIAGKVRSYGISQAQVTFLVNLHANETHRRATATADAPIGRQVVTGTLVGVKTVESQFGTVLKGVVDLGTGAKVYGTLPAAGTHEKGQTVTFTATFEQSHDDKLFGFWKRPTKWSVKL